MDNDLRDLLEKFLISEKIDESDKEIIQEILEKENSKGKIDGK